MNPGMFISHLSSFFGFNGEVAPIFGEISSVAKPHSIISRSFSLRKVGVFTVFALRLLERRRMCRFITGLHNAKESIAESIVVFKFSDSSLTLLRCS
jgi:hypothetical protein